MRRNTRAIAMPFFILATAGLASVVEAANPPARSQQIQIVAEEMCCKGCVQKVAGQLYAAPGVTVVEANIENKTVLVTVSRQKGASLEQLWQAVAAGEGGPTSLTTAEATYTMTRPDGTSGKSLPPRAFPPQGITYIVIDNLHCKGCAQRIAAQLYTLQGVSKVNANMKQNRLTVTSKGQHLSPWALVGAVARAKERPVAIVGASGRMDIAWSAPKKESAHQTSKQPNNQGVQR